GWCPSTRKLPASPAASLSSAHLAARSRTRAPAGSPASCSPTRAGACPWPHFAPGCTAPPPRPGSARLPDATVREEYERALTLARAQPGPVLPGRALPPADVTGGRRQDTPLIKSRLAGGYCPRTAAQGPCACACACASICEHCPNFCNDPAFLPILAAQRADAEAARHRNLIERPDLLISRAQAS